MGLTILAFMAIFVLLCSAGMLIFFRGTMMERLSDAISQPEDSGWRSFLKFEGAGTSIKAIVEPFDRVLPKSPKEISLARTRLNRAGYRDDSHFRILYGAKALVPLGLCLVVAVSGVTEYFGAFFAYTLALAIGYLAPDFWLGRQIKKRQLQIRLGLPEFLDLMVICIEAGVGLDQAVSRSVEELATSQPALADEMGLVQLEQRAGRPRIDAWRNVGERVDIDVMTTLVSAIIQSDQLGTSLAKTLRTYSDSLRIQRRQRVEEMAAKTAVKLVFPLVFFIFPSLYVVALGPAIIVMVDAFQKYFHQ